MDIFPNAKVVLTVRDPARWYESVKGTLMKHHEHVTGPIGLFTKLVGKLRVFEVVLQSDNQVKHGINDTGKYISGHKKLFHNLLL